MLGVTNGEEEGRHRSRSKFFDRDFWEHMAVIAAIIVAAFTATTYFSGRADVKDQQLVKTIQEISTVENQYAVIRAQIDDLQQTRTITGVKLDKISDALARVSAQLEDLKDARNHR